MARPLTVACLQTRPCPTAEEALGEALGLAEQASTAGAQFLFLPEYCGGLKSEGAALVPPAFEEDVHPVLQGLRRFARDHQIWIMVGSIAVPAADGKIINRGFVLNPSGEIVSRYDKIHLFDIQISETEVYRESARVIAGDRISLVETAFGKIGHTICYDLRFGQLYRDLALAGAEILCTPAAFLKKTGQAHWHVLNRARAIENGAFGLFVIPLVLMVALVPSIRLKSRTKPLINLQSIPFQLFEWRSGFRRNGIFVAICYVIGLVCAFYPAGPLVSIIIISYIITSFYDELEAPIMIEQFSPLPVFLMKKLQWHLSALLLLFLPLGVAFLSLHFSFWYLLLIALFFSLALTSFALCYKYSVYRPHRKRAFNQNAVAFFSAGIFIPLFLPGSIYFLFRNFQKAQIRLNWFYSKQ